jgi:putative transposase
MIFALMVQGRGSLVSSVPPSYSGHRYPVEVISHCVWLYFRFPLSYREVEELMLQRLVLCGGGAPVRAEVRKRAAPPSAPAR